MDQGIKENHTATLHPCHGWGPQVLDGHKKLHLSSHICFPLNSSLLTTRYYHHSNLVIYSSVSKLTPVNLWLVESVSYYLVGQLSRQDVKWLWSSLTAAAAWCPLSWDATPKTGSSSWVPWEAPGTTLAVWWTIRWAASPSSSIATRWPAWSRRRGISHRWEVCKKNPWRCRFQDCSVMQNGFKKKCTHPGMFKGRIGTRIALNKKKRWRQPSGLEKHVL